MKRSRMILSAGVIFQMFLFGQTAMAEPPGQRRDGTLGTTDPGLLNASEVLAQMKSEGSALKEKQDFLRLSAYRVMTSGAA